MLPNFIIPGAQKSGTTALRIYPAQHPDIYMVSKEIHFFDNEENYREGIGWYEKFFNDWNGEEAVGEKTPDYLYNEYAPNRIYKYIRKYRLLRDFIKRINTKKGKTPSMKKDTRKKLQEYFESYNEELKKFIGLDISRWENEGINSSF